MQCFCSALYSSLCASPDPPSSDLIPGLHTITLQVRGNLLTGSLFARSYAILTRCRCSMKRDYLFYLTQTIKYMPDVSNVRTRCFSLSVIGADLRRR